MVLSTDAKVKEELMDIPNDYECPITHELMEDPVIAADGFSYEKSSIEEWFRRGDRTSPKTGAELLHTNLTPNQTLKNVIIEFKQRLSYIQREQQTKTDLDIAIRLLEEDIEYFFQKLKKADSLQTKKKVSQQVKNESIEYAEKQGIIGPRSLVGFKLKDVDDKGNCFYESIVDQLELINHEFISQTPYGTKAHDRLSLLFRDGQNFQDLEWADDKIFDEFVRKFSDVILAIIDTRIPQAGFVCYYYEDDNIITNTGELEISLPKSRPILRIASTGNHFLSIIGHPYLEKGALKIPSML